MELFASGELVIATLHPSASPAEFATYLRREHERWGKVIKDANIKPE